MTGQPDCATRFHPVTMILLLLLSGAMAACAGGDVCGPYDLVSIDSLSPGDLSTEGIIIDSLDPEFTWVYPDSSCHPETFRLRIATNWADYLADPDEGIDLPGDQTSWSPESSLQPGTTYIWSVRAYSSDSYSTSPQGIFRTGPLCDITSPALLEQPIPIEPPDGAVVSGVNLTLEWEDPTECIADGHYVIEIDESAGFPDPFTGTYSMPYLFVAHPWVDFDLESCTTYYWRVHFDHADRPDEEDGPLSSVFSFTTSGVDGEACLSGPLVTYEPEPESTYLPADAAPVALAPLNITCRQGPDLVFPGVGYLLEGESAVIEGRNQADTWWWIANPDRDGYCWVAQNLIEASGDVESVIVVEAPFTPVPEGTMPPPAERCAVWSDQYQQYIWGECLGDDP